MLLLACASATMAFAPHPHASTTQQSFRVLDSNQRNRSSSRFVAANANNGEGQGHQAQAQVFRYHELFMKEINEDADAVFQSADANGNREIDVSELMRRRMFDNIFESLLGFVV
jgi:hypothetical protein